MKKTFAAALCLLGLAGAEINAQENRHVRIVNRSSSSIEYLYVSNVDNGSWLKDILGPWRVIAPGYYLNANIDDGSGHCYYDLRAVLVDKRQAVRYRFNVCTESSWTVMD
jgi:hypothetical protein